MTCYFRHLNSVFADAEIDVTKENKKELDQIIHGIVGVQYKDCSKTWHQVKQRLADDQDGFVLELKNAWQNRI